MVETRHALSLPTIKQLDKNDFKIRAKIPFHRLWGDTRAFPCALRRRGVARKSAVTKHVRRLGYQFTWQSRFHDYIIRNDLEYNRIVKYIQNNPQNWHKVDNPLPKVRGFLIHPDVSRQEHQWCKQVPERGRSTSFSLPLQVVCSPLPLGTVKQIFLTSWLEYFTHSSSCEWNPIYSLFEVLN